MKKRGFVVLTVITGVWMIVYILWRTFYTLPDWRIYGWVAFLAGLYLLIAETLSMVEALLHCMDLNYEEAVEMPVISPEWYPHVDVFIATHNEGKELLYKTANACVRMKYPDKKKVHVYLCDDMNRPEVKELANQLNIGYFGLSENKYAKAGNLNNALSKTKSPLIATFDADMIPGSDFLLETVPYFFLPKMKKNEDGIWVEREKEEIDETYKVGFIQTPQSFYNPDLFQYNLYSEKSIPNEQDFFFRQVNIGKNHSNSCIYAGSNTVISREALEEVGGIATGTITEDFETGLLIESKGYRCYAVDKLLAKGLAPNTIDALLKQRERWARGCIHSLRKVHIILNKDINFPLKIGYLACRIYWGSFARRLIFIIAPLLYVLLGIPVVICDFRQLFFIWLPSYILYSIVLKKISGNIRDTKWSNTIDTIIFPYMILPILAETLGIRKKKFHVTEKNRSLRSEETAYMALPHGILLVLSLISLAMMVRDLLKYEAIGALIIIYWLFVNSFSLLMAVFFMMGRRNVRMTERFETDFPLEILYDGKSYQGTVIDISEGGFAFTLEDAVYLSYRKEDKVKFCLRYHEYCAKVYGHIVSVSSIKGGNMWKYSVMVSEMDHKNKSEYMQIIFDRVHTMPKKLKNSSYFKDISANLFGRKNTPQASQRKMARIQVNCPCELEDGRKVVLENYNFEYVRLSFPETMEHPDKLTLFSKTDYAMRCKKSAVNSSVYEVENREELKENKAFELQVRKWEAADE